MLWQATVAGNPSCFAGEMPLKDFRSLGGCEIRQGNKTGKHLLPLASGSSAGTRTQNPPVTLIPAFPQGVDYLIIHMGCRALWDVLDRLLIPSLCTFPATDNSCPVKRELPPFTELGSGLPPPEVLRLS